MTSRQVVDVAARAVRPAKAGHAGTLDPLAQGVVVVCVGLATRLIEYVQRMPKHYRGEFLLGRESPTEDVDGEVSMLDDPPIPRRGAVEAACGEFLGAIEQRPPAYSALKVSGRRAYDLARKGQSFTLEPRTVSVHRLEVVRYEYPTLVLDIECGSGTYVRSLGRDLAASLGTAAVMSGLVRRAIGRFTLDEACPVDALSPSTWEQFLLPAIRAVDYLPTLALAADECERIAHGLTIERADLPAGEAWAAIAPGGELAAVLKMDQSGRLRTARNFIART